MDEGRIQIIIPVFNNVDELDETLDSIYHQNYDEDKLYIAMVDFGSTDGSYEKLWTYHRNHTGIYQKPYQKNMRQRIADCAKLVKYSWWGSGIYRSVLVYPGDILYPDCLKTMMDFCTKYHEIDPGMVVAECDIREDDGRIYPQIPLYTEDRIINGLKNRVEFVNKGFRHMTFQMGLGFLQEKYKASYEWNESRYWNKLGEMVTENNTLYLSKPLACVKRISYEDEFQEILFRWEGIISAVRFQNAANHLKKDSEYEKEIFRSIGMYALWRSFHIYLEGVDMKTAEDCFLISSVIDESIKQEDIYHWMEQLIEAGDTEQIGRMKEFFLNT